MKSKITAKDLQVSLGLVHTSTMGQKGELERCPYGRTAYQYDCWCLF